MSDDAKMIKVEEEIEGERVGSNDYIFERIGEPVPIQRDESCFDLHGSPSRPLAVSEKHGLVFVAHSSGFCVARTKDVMASAAEIKERGSSSSIQELSVVDVPLPNLNILELSTDSSTLAATADANIHFFSVDSLLDKGLKPSFSCSLNESSSIKDMQWTRKPENFYVVLSNLGKLYHGTVGGPMKDVMDNVDAVGWSFKGKLIAVARRDILSILSSNFKDRLSMLISFKSWTDDSNANCSIKVDSIRWVRHDSIILGCFQLTADGNEESYLVQVIKIKDGKFAYGSCKPVLIPFYDLFSGLTDDILPSASGPYLLLSYLEQCELAITANRKNVDQHIVYLSWSLGNEKNEVVVVDIFRDSLLPRIELQENDDENLILGLCVDKISRSEKISVRLGEEQRELSPYCILMCLTLEGKLIMFHVASVSGITVSPTIVSVLSDEEEEEEDSTVLVPVESKSSRPSSWLGKEQLEKVSMDAPLGIENRKELDRNVGLDFRIKDDIKSLDVNETLTSEFVTNQTINKESTNSNKKVEPLTNSQSFEADGQQEVIVPKHYPDKNGNQLQFPGLENRNIGSASTNVSLQGVPGHAFRDLTKTETQKIAGLGTAVQSTLKDTHKSFETAAGSPGKMEPTGLEGVSSQSWSSGNIISSKDTDVKSLLMPSNFIEGSRSGNANQIVAPIDAYGKPSGKPLHFKNISGSSTSGNFSDRLTENWGQRPSAAAGNIVSLPSISSSLMSSQESFSVRKSPNYNIYPSKESYSDLPPSRRLNSEPNSSKQFGNIKEMTKELDMLLQSIEEPGGFKDACTVNQKRSVEELERGIGTLSDRCRKWKSIMDERLQEIEHLLDITVQVLARKIYMEGIVKQASDSRYWDFWNCQKLSSELELKRRHILKMNQDLTDQLIQLERHFNALELNKFGENAGAHAGRRALQSRFGPSRHIQSLHSLYSTMTSQLAAADHLSECLSKQMAALKIESPSVKKKNVKKELFETIGIPYDASFNSPSPDATKVGGMPNEKLSFSLGSAASKDQPRRNVNAIKNYEPETARRRRDSLDRSWEDYEPTKATVKRLLLQESGKESTSRSSFAVDKQHFSPRLLEGSAITGPRDHISPATFLHPSENKGIQGMHVKQPFQSSATPFVWANELQGPLQPTGLTSPIMQEHKMSSASQLLPAGRQSFAREPNMTAEKFGNGILYIEKSESDSVKEKSVVQSDTSQKPSVSLVPTQTPSLPKKPNDMLNSFAKGTLPKQESVKDRPLTATVPSIEAGKKLNFPLSSSFAVPVATSQPGKVDQRDAATSKSQPGKILPSPTFSMSVSTPSSPVISSSSAPLSPLSISPSVVMPSNRSVDSSNTTADVSKPVSTSSLSFPSPIVSPCSFFSFDASNPLVSSSAPSPVTNSTSESSKTEIQHSFKTDTNANTILPPQECGPSTVETNLKLKPSVSSPHTIETSTGLTSGSQASSNNTAGPTNNVRMNAQQEQPSAGHSPFPTLPTLGSVTGGRTDGLDVQNAQEDDMDEEAPDTSSTTELSLGSLGGFGLGSAPNPTAPKPNPFGGSFGNAGTNVTSPFSMTVPSGELFRPASFNIQSLQPSQSSQPANSGGFAGGFGTGTTAQAPSPSKFGQPVQVGPGQQALGSVLGTFGQSRQLGTSLPGTSFGSPGGFGGGIAGTNPSGGFSSAATGGFAGAASAGGGFASLASGGGGFGGAGSGGGGFASAGSGGGGFAGAGSGGVGFVGAASAGSGFTGAVSSGGLPAAGGGFAAFGGQQGSGGFSGFGNAGGTGKPPELFTQMRK
ncbi:PREDICTED: nuclear pore complex [Prunus dulcis]|uniref:PREDICTED: nuclear pore complex n=1 Tax=Prunus dulcis TaxID=3755 RepID=A0A5E4FWH5_PRUDU|nr:nuclear pore complex protein NUP214 isoform X2 [Prunus dulcis]VVA31817.1 PREDICTED: nuclear pore complex [Prunus dulcis]